MLLREFIQKYRMDHNNMSQRAFASKCGLSNAYISMIEKGINPSTGEEPVLSLSSIRKLASGMDMSGHDLIKSVDDIRIDISGEESIDDGQGPSKKAMKIAVIYDSLTDTGKELVDGIAAFAEKHHKSK